tara:strand:- start:84 stop:524 length:441 start_codon:yes stop_codon:yes gene_type:complete
MTGKFFVISLLIFTIGFSIALYYFQVFAFYTMANGLTSIEVFGRLVTVQNYRGIDSVTSGLKLRGCFSVDIDEFSQFQELEKATPLAAPFWFSCFDHKNIQEAIDSGNAKAFLVSENEKDGIDRVVAIYPNGNAFQWRQLNSKFLD